MSRWRNWGLFLAMAVGLFPSGGSVSAQKTRSLRQKRPVLIRVEYRPQPRSGQKRSEHTPQTITLAVMHGKAMASARAGLQKVGPRQLRPLRDLSARSGKEPALAEGSLPNHRPRDLFAKLHYRFGDGPLKTHHFTLKVPLIGTKSFVQVDAMIGGADAALKLPEGRLLGATAHLDGADRHIVDTFAQPGITLEAARQGRSFELSDGTIRTLADAPLERTYLFHTADGPQQIRITATQDGSPPPSKRIAVPERALVGTH